MRVLIVLSLVLAAVFSSGCPTDSCTPNETRCLGNQAEICGSDQNWRMFMDCDDLGSPGWTCCWLPADPTLDMPAGHGCIEGPCPEVE